MFALALRSPEPARSPGSTLNDAFAAGAVIPVGNTPQGITLTPDGARAYVSTANAGTVGVMMTTVIPHQGPTAGGTTVPLTGHHLANATAVRFGATRAVIQRVADTTVTATSPPSAAEGTFDVTVTTPGGTPAGAFTYVAGPGI